MPVTQIKGWTDWQRPGFTLVQLLVVMTVIAILAGLLMPTLSRAKEKGRMAVCLSNQRQLQVAAMVYAWTTASG